MLSLNTIIAICDACPAIDAEWRKSRHWVRDKWQALLRVREKAAAHYGWTDISRRSNALAIVEQRICASTSVPRVSYQAYWCLGGCGGQMSGDGCVPLVGYAMCASCYWRANESTIIVGIDNMIALHMALSVDPPSHLTLELLYSRGNNPFTFSFSPPAAICHADCYAIRQADLERLVANSDDKLH
jgi:hypothetical protein